MVQVDFWTFLKWLADRNYDTLEWENVGIVLKYVLNGKTEALLDVVNNIYFMREDLI